jgi:hypothetical protein
MHVRLVNPLDTELHLVLEPWGETYSIPPDGAIDLKAHGPKGDALEIAHESDAIIVWGWPGSTIRVFRGSEELGSVQSRPPAPVSASDSESANHHASGKNHTTSSKSASTKATHRRYL